MRERKEQTMPGPKVAKSVTKHVKTTTRYEFSHAELCKRLRLPESAVLGVWPLEGTDAPVAIAVVGTALVAEVTSEASK
jgi:hypothetical protein